MLRSVSVVVPVKDGARYLPELLAAVREQASDARGLEILVIDSGSTDGSVDIARAAGARVVQIDPAEFGHGRTRNLGAEQTSGELIVFLTQDATPVAGWLRAIQEGFMLDGRVGAVYGPHLHRPDTSPMIARELEAFFAGHTPDGEPRVQRAGDEPFLSNVNAAYARACWEEIRFADVPYSEDQRFARAMLAAGWSKVFHPRAAVRHAHDYTPRDFMRRYFDEYRGLRETIGHVEDFGVRSSVADVRRLAAADRAWMRAQGWPVRRRARWTGRSLVHHAGRKVFSALGSRAHGLPPAVQRRMSLEGTASTMPAELPDDGPVRGTALPAYSGPRPFESILQVARDGPTPLLEPVPGMDTREQLHIALVIPPFRRGSGGHNSIFQMALRLERMGHTVSVWVHDGEDLFHGQWPAVTAHDIREWFAPLKAPVFHGFDYWYGADVAVATGWQTVHPLLTLDQCRARAYLVHDHEPEFYATSAEQRFAEQTYQFGLHAITASPWLQDLVVNRYGGTASPFDFGVDHDVYKPLPVPRRRDTIVFYSRAVTPRRAVPLGMIALEELRRRRPDLRIVLFGDPVSRAPFAHEHLGIASPQELARLYSAATVGLCLSMTNYSLIPQEMLACGLPCVDLAGFSAETVFGIDGPVELVGFDALELADAIERLLDSSELWQRRSEAGRAFVADRTWDRAAEQLDAGLREALRRRFDDPSATKLAAPTAPLAVNEGAALDVAARIVPTAGEQRRRATARLIGRLSPDDVADVEASLEGDTRVLWRDCDAGMRERLAVSFGVWYRVPAVLEKTGLRPDEPPESVHAMARGPLAAGGDLYTADLVADSLAAAGTDLADVRHALDFGCSSGRTVRALAAAYPNAEWYGVDPNAEAVKWAAAHLPGATFAPSSSEPPLPFADASFDLVYAISVWSHFGEAAALAWLDEMRRVIRPGGYLLLTVHGLQSIAHDARAGTRPPGQLEAIRRVLYRRGFWFAAEFDDETGDHGVSHADWGTAFMTTEWLLRHTTPAWEILTYEVGRNGDNQDVIVLRRPEA